MKFDLKTFKQVTLTDSTTFLESTFIAASCTCDNVILEAHYSVYFDQLSDSNSFVIKEVVVDVVYGTTDSTDACTSANHYQLKTSLTYLQYDDTQALAHKYSGAPGYIKGSPILIANQATVTQNNADGTQTSVDVYPFYRNGFPFRGADQNGQCYWVGTTTYTPPPTATRIATKDELLYFDDPVFTFEDDMMFGCSLDFTYDQLKNFCDVQGWKTLMLLQNIYEMKWFGKSANANPHFEADWSEVEVSEKDKFDDKGTWDEDGTCKFPNMHVLEVYYQKVNTKEDPQYLILSVEKSSLI